jgi:hypothetical protein
VIPNLQLAQRSRNSIYVKSVPECVHGYLRGSGNAEVDKGRNVGVIDIARSGKHQRGGCAGHSGAFQSAGAATIARPAAVERAILDEEVRAVLSATGVRDEMSTVYGSSSERVGQWIPPRERIAHSVKAVYAASDSENVRLRRFCNLFTRWDFGTGGHSDSARVRRYRLAVVSAVICRNRE